MTDYYNVNPDYGSRAVFKQLADSVHQKGMKIIIDYVMNHTSNQHPWFVSSSSTPSSPYRSWYVWQQNNPGFAGPWGEQVWYPLNGSYYYGVFWSGMPDLNYRDTGVRNKMLNVAGYWLDSMHIDGFRLDAIQYLVEDGDTLLGTPGTHDYLTAFRNFYTVHNPQAFTVGEVTASTAQVVPYVGPTQLNSCFEFDLAAAIIASVNAKDPTAVRGKMAQIVASYPFLQYATFLSNHDQNRVFDQVTDDQKRMSLAAGLLLTLPGIPFIYYGEEIAMSGSGSDSAKRTPMQWTNGTNAGFTTATQPWEGINGKFATFNVQSFQNDSSSLWHSYQKLISARHALPALRLGTYAPMQTNLATVYGFARYTAGQLVLAFHNFDSVTAVVSTATLQSSGLVAGNYLPVNFLTPQGTVNAIPVNAGGGFTNYNPGITLAPYSTALLVVNNQTGHVSPIQTETRPSICIKTTRTHITIECASFPFGRWSAEIVDPKGRILVRSTPSAGSSSVTIVKTAWPIGLYIVYIVKDSKRVSWTKIMLHGR